MVPRRSITAHDLPDQLLGRILELAGKKTGPSVTLVCKSWHRAFYSQPAIWRDVCLDTCPQYSMRGRHMPDADREQWFVCKSALLERVAGLVAEVTVRTTYASAEQNFTKVGERTASRWQLADLLNLLEPGCLTTVSLSQPALIAGQLTWLLPAVRFPSLAALHLDSPQLPPVTASVIRKLTQLESLRCNTSELPDGMLQGVLHLSGLTQLALSAAALPAAQQLTRLQQLRHLSLSTKSQSLQPPPPADLRRLERYKFEMYRSAAPGTMQLAGSQLCSCPYGTLAVEFTKSSGHAANLEIGGVGSLQSLNQLLTTLLPRGTPLGSLFIRHSELAPAGFDMYTPHLAAVTRLRLYACTSTAGVGAVLRLMLPQAWSLADLQIENSLFGMLPECLTTKRGLTALRLAENDLHQLPPGPYLSALEELDLSANSFSRLPRALAAATALQSLSLYSNDRLKIKRADVDDVLLRMPRLRTLGLGAVKATHYVLLHLSRSLPRQLDIVVPEEEDGEGDEDEVEGQGSGGEGSQDEQDEEGGEGDGNGGGGGDDDDDW